MSNKIMLSVITLCLLCSPAARVQSQETGPALSTIHSDKLIQSMRRLNELAYEREYTELGLDRLRADQIHALVRETEILVNKAKNLSEIVTGGQLTSEERITFRAIASQLHTEAVSLQTAISANNFVNVDAGYRRLQETCNACHNLFRNQ